jgi:hypothetical protein
MLALRSNTNSKTNIPLPNCAVYHLAPAVAATDDNTSFEMYFSKSNTNFIDDTMYFWIYAYQ